MAPIASCPYSACVPFLDLLVWLYRHVCVFVCVHVSCDRVWPHSGGWYVWLGSAVESVGVCMPRRRLRMPVEGAQALFSCWSSVFLLLIPAVTVFDMAESMAVPLESDLVCLGVYVSVLAKLEDRSMSRIADAILRFSAAEVACARPPLVSSLKGAPMEVSGMMRYAMLTYWRTEVQLTSTVDLAYQRRVQQLAIDVIDEAHLRGIARAAYPDFAEHDAWNSVCDFVVDMDSVRCMQRPFVRRMMHTGDLLYPLRAMDAVGTAYRQVLDRMQHARYLSQERERCRVFFLGCGCYAPDWALMHHPFSDDVCMHFVCMRYALNAEQWPLRLFFSMTCADVYRAVRYYHTEQKFCTLRIAPFIPGRLCLKDFLPEWERPLVDDLRGTTLEYFFESAEDPEEGVSDGRRGE